MLEGSCGGYELECSMQVHAQRGGELHLAPGMAAKMLVSTLPTTLQSIPDRPCDKNQEPFIEGSGCKSHSVSRTTSLALKALPHSIRAHSMDSTALRD